MKSYLIAVTLMLLSPFIFAEDATLRFSYWQEATPPFVILDETQDKIVKSGVLKELAEQIAAHLNMQVKFINLPVLRIEPQLSAGEVDIDCITRPDWKKHPDNLHWSPVIFQGADRLLVKTARKHEFKVFEDLKGKLLAVYNGYTYHPKITEMINNGEITSVKVSGIDHAVNLLSLDRIDALIDFDVLLENKIASGYQESLALADLIVERYDLYCAYSKKIKIEANLVDSVIKKMVETGEINDMLNRKYH